MTDDKSIIHQVSVGFPHSFDNKQEKWRYKWQQQRPSSGQLKD